MEVASNGIDATKANRYVAEIERELAELLDERITYMNRCKPHHENIADWKERASEDGVPKRALNKILKERGYLRSIAKLNAALEDEDRDLVDDLRAKLKPVADLPLFGAAIEHAEAGSGSKVVPINRRGKKAAESTEASPAPSGSDPLGSLVNDEIPDDVRPAFLRDKDKAAAEANAAALAGIKPLN